MDVFQRNGYRAAAPPPAQTAQARAPKAKIGQGHAAAMGRLGLKELRNAVNPSKESAADSELGLYGTMTPGKVADTQGHGNRQDKQQERQLQQQQRRGQSLGG
jgi:hypothetical protein